MAEEKKHFVLVHGANHGAWCWYKLIPLLESSGHKVTALDLAASGINTQKFTEILTLHDHAAPLLDFIASLPPEEKVILVGHSFGGFNLALAMETFPHKILLGVFLSAFMPNIANPPSTLWDEYFRVMPQEALLDTQLITYGHSEAPETAILFGPEQLAVNLYQLSPIEDVELVKSLARPTSLLTRDFARPNYFSNEGYGSVKRAYIKALQDRSVPLNFQRWLIENFSVKVVKEIAEADHMSMISTPQILSQLLIELADKYA